MNKPNLEKEGLPHPLQQSLTPHLRCGTFEGNLLFAMYEQWASPSRSEAERYAICWQSYQDYHSLPDFPALQLAAPSFLSLPGLTCKVKHVAYKIQEIVKVYTQINCQDKSHFSFHYVLQFLILYTTFTVLGIRYNTHIVKPNFHIFFKTETLSQLDTNLLKIRKNRNKEKPFF